jgi:four helix bundle protein
MSSSSYRDLLVWQRAMDLAVEVYVVTKDLPADERFGLRSQARRAAASVPSNIAEGKGRWYVAEFLQSLSYAKSSLQELETQIELMLRLGYKSPTDVSKAVSLAVETGRMLSGFNSSLRSKVQSKRKTRNRRNP